MFRAAFVFVAALALAAGIPARPAHAGRWSLTPELGPYIPATRLAFSTSAPIIVQLEPGTSLGAALRWRHSSRLAFDATVGYGRNQMNLISNDYVDLDEAFVNTDAIARWGIARDPGPVKWELLAGVGAYRLRGSFADLIRSSGNSGLHARTRLSVIAGLGASWMLRDAVALQIDGTDRMHGPGIEVDDDAGTPGFSRAVQHDVSMTVGLTLPLGK